MPIPEGRGPFRITKNILGISGGVVATILLIPLCIFMLFKLRTSKGSRIEELEFQLPMYIKPRLHMKCNEL